jgi:sec-independent protein translocase protein TatA
MAGFSLMHWVIVALVILVLFGRGKISETMGDFGKGIKSFRKGLSEEESAPVSKPAQIAQINDDKSQGVPVDTAARTTNP